ncbi:uncharacterized protein LDX57_002901 [Aspergillus melleus]|uniref:uncharacterized protein n=1 Tax=Aspergillus melleus TaxID=138277 RepID=UPI001E8EE413|nr:uncharacterized protein LDX57_002901 [Aspergillus melleus]KAH8425152.1 hypothetical protein LDX57_002901 [Aspergillus melleus]
MAILRDTNSHITKPNIPRRKIGNPSPNPNHKSTSYINKLLSNRTCAMSGLYGSHVMRSGDYNFVMFNPTVRIDIFLRPYGTRMTCVFFIEAIFHSDSLIRERAEDRDGNFFGAYFCDAIGFGSGLGIKLIQYFCGVIMRGV